MKFNSNTGYLQTILEVLIHYWLLYLQKYNMLPSSAIYNRYAGKITNF
ncbi:MAG: hypothetical protein ACFFAS_04015 [Promethearchaeota archaeon]